MQYHIACVWDSFLKLRNVWTTPSVWFYILYSHIYFLFIAFHLYRLHTKCIESRVHSFYFTFTRSILASVCISFCIVLLEEQQVCEHKNRSSQINQFPLFVLCLDIFWCLIESIWCIRPTIGWQLFNLQFSVISRAIIYQNCYI